MAFLVCDGIFSHVVVGHYSTQRNRSRRFSELHTLLVHRASSRTVKVTQRNPFLKKQQTNKEFLYSVSKNLNIKK